MAWEVCLWMSLTGLVAGVLGGLLGIGGSVIMIPAFVVIFPRLCGIEEKGAYHVAQAVAMCANVVVAVPAAIRHGLGGRVSVQVLKWMLPAALVAVVVGVYASNQINGQILRYVFGVMLLLLAALFLFRRKAHEDWPQDGLRQWPGAPVGGLVGMMAGLLGIGGGVIAVPLLSKSSHMPIKRCVGTSAVVMCLTAPLGAWRKLAGLQGLEVGMGDGFVTWQAALLLAACIAPAALVGSWLGAGLTARLPVVIVRVSFVTLLLIAAVKMFV